MDSQTQAVVFSVIALLGWGLGNSVNKKYSKVLGPTKLVVYRNSLTALITAIVLLIFWETAVFNLPHILLGIGLSFLGYIGLILMLKGLATGKLGLIMPIVSSRVVISVLIGVLLLGDHLSGWQGIFVAIIFLGIILSSIDPRAFRNSKILSKGSGVPYALLNAALWGVVYPFYSIPSMALGAFLFSFILEFTVLVSSIVHMRIRNQSLALPPEVLKKNLGGLLFLGFAGGVGTVFGNLGYATGHVAIVSAVVGAVPLIAVLYGKFVYKEHLNKRQAVSVALMIIGVILLAYF